MAVLALVLDRHAEDALLPDIVDHGHTIAARLATARELITRLDGLAIDAVVTGASPSALSSELIAACDARGIRVIAIAAFDAERRRAADLGLFEVLAADARWDDVEALLVRRVERAPLVTAPVGDALGAGVIAVWGAVGSPGRTTLAVNLAAEIAASGRDVLLVDADTYGGAVAPMLGMLDEAPGLAAACRLAGADSLTGAELDRVAQRYSARTGAFRVLTGIGRSARWPELAEAKVAAVLAACRRFCDVVVVDTGFNLESDEEISSDMFAPKRNGATIAALRAADHIVAVGAPDPVGLARFLRGYAELVELAAPVCTSIVINRMRSSAVGLGAGSQVRATLQRFGGIERAHLVPDDQRGVDAALLAGRPLRDTVPASPARRAIAAFATEELLPAPVEARRARGVGRRRPAASVAASNAG